MFYRRNAAQMSVVLIGLKALRAISLCQVFSVMFQYDFPVTLFTFYCLVGSSMILLPMQQPWNGRKNITPNQVKLIYLKILPNLVVDSNWILFFAYVT